jgi:hypothetical protein
LPLFLVSHHDCFFFAGYLVCDQDTSPGELNIPPFQGRAALALMDLQQINLPGF